MENNNTTHPLLRHCNQRVTAAVLAVGCLVIWGLTFPITLFAQTDPAYAGDRYSTSSFFGPERRMMDDARPENNLQKPHNQPMMFRSNADQKQAKRRVQGLIMSLTEFKKQVNVLQKQGVTVPDSLSADVDKVIADIKSLSQSVEASQVKPKTPPTPAPAPESNEASSQNTSAQ